MSADVPDNSPIGSGSYKMCTIQAASSSPKTEPSKGNSIHIQKYVLILSCIYLMNYGIRLRLIFISILLKFKLIMLLITNKIPDSNTFP